MTALELFLKELKNDANLQGYWRLEDVNDSGPNGYNLTNNGTATFVAGKFNNAVSLNGSSKYLNIADASCANLEFTGSRTISAWVNPASFAAIGAIIGKRGTDYATNAGYIFYIDTSGLVHFTIDGLTTNTDVTSSIALTLSSWNHVVGVYDGASLLIYINGYLNARLPATGTGASANSWPFSIGCDNQGTSNAAGLFFNGLIDDVSVYNRALTAAEILNLYNQAFKKINGIARAAHQIADDPLLTDANLKAYYKFNSGALTTDSGPNGLTLTAASSPIETAGKFGGGVDYGSSGNNGHYVNNDLGITNGAYTVGCWVNFNSIAAGAAIINIGDYGTQVGTRFDWYQPAASLRFYRVAFGGVGQQGPTLSWTPTIGTWYFLVMTYDGTNVKGYIDGVLIGTVAASGNGSGTTIPQDRLYINGDVQYGNFGYAKYDDCFAFNRALTATEIYRLYNGNIKKLMGKTITGGNEIASMPLASNANLKAYYKLDNNLTDSSASGYNLTDSSSTNSATAKFGTARDFQNGSTQGVTGQYAYYTDPTNLKVTGNKTVSYWVYSDTLPQSGYLYTIWGMYGSGTFFNEVTSAGILSSKIGGFSTNGTVSSTTALVVGNWYHIVHVLNGTTHSIYVNNSATSATVTGTENSYGSGCTLALGRPGNYNGQYFDGKIDDFAFFDRALTATEISNIYNTQIKKYMGISNV